MLFLLRNEPQTKDTPVELHLMLGVLEKFPFACAKRVSIKQEWMLHVLWRKNKPAPFQLANQKVSGRQTGDLRKIGTRKAAHAPDHIAILTRVAVSFRSQLEQ